MIKRMECKVEDRFGEPVTVEFEVGFSRDEIWIDAIYTQDEWLEKQTIDWINRNRDRWPY